jgi:hypothetical protein
MCLFVSGQPCRRRVCRVMRAARRLEVENPIMDSPFQVSRSRYADACPHRCWLPPFHLNSNKGSAEHRAKRGRTQHVARFGRGDKTYQSMLRAWPGTVIITRIVASSAQMSVEYSPRRPCQTTWTASSIPIILEIGWCRIP